MKKKTPEKKISTKIEFSTLFVSSQNPNANNWQIWFLKFVSADNRQQWHAKLKEPKQIESKQKQRFSHSHFHSHSHTDTNTDSHSLIKQKKHFSISFWKSARVRCGIDADRMCSTRWCRRRPTRRRRACKQIGVMQTMKTMVECNPHALAMTVMMTTTATTTNECATICKMHLVCANFRVYGLAFATESSRDLQSANDRLFEIIPIFFWRSFRASFSETFYLTIVDDDDAVAVVANRQFACWK